jgi:hypothetical protein
MQINRMRLTQAATNVGDGEHRERGGGLERSFFLVKGDDTWDPRGIPITPEGGGGIAVARSCGIRAGENSAAGTCSNLQQNPASRTESRVLWVRRGGLKKESVTGAENKAL